MGKAALHRRQITQRSAKSAKPLRLTTRQGQRTTTPQSTTTTLRCLATRVHLVISAATSAE